MKKIIYIMLCFLVILPFKCNAQELAENAKSGILIEYTTGKVIFEKNSNERLAPASMTKIMTLLVTFDAIDSGKIKMDDLVTVSSNAAGMGGSQMFLEANSQVKLEEIIKGVSVASANDGAVALAEYVGGTVDKFVEMMNNKASELGLENTHFANPHGLDTDNHYSSSYDMAIMAMNLIKHKDILRFTSIYEDYFNKPDGTRTWLVNTNKLVRFYEGVDGLKTGYTENAGYCLTSTALKNGIRFITVLMGEPTSDLRTKETTAMLNYAFNSFKLNTIIDSSKELGKVKIEKGMEDYGTLVTKYPVTELISNTDEVKEYSYNIKVDNIKAPILVGDKVGTVEILDNEGVIIREEELTVKDSIAKANFIHIFKKNLLVFLQGK